MEQPKFVYTFIACLEGTAVELMFMYHKNSKLNIPFVSFSSLINCENNFETSILHKTFASFPFLNRAQDQNKQKLIYLGVIKKARQFKRKDTFIVRITNRLAFNRFK
jgi:hypothetical protein